MITNENLTTVIKEHTDLLDRIEKQMKDDVDNKVLKPDTIRRFELARENFIAAGLDGQKPEDVLHFFGRGCANYGEFMSLQKVDRHKR